MNTYSRLLCFVVILLSLHSCVEITNKFDKLPPGIWRAELILENKNFIPDEKDEDVQLGVNELDDTKLPFNFEIKYDDKGAMVFYFMNGEETIEVTEVLFGRNNKLSKDSFRVSFPEYGSHISAMYEENGMTGEFVIPAKNNYSIPFTAVYGQPYRFTPLKKTPAWDMNGKWECTFEEGTEDEYKAIGEFKQEANHLTGTFLTETGDYRFLEGTIQDNKAYLSVFDGSHAFLFTVKMIDKDNIIGTFRSGKHYKSSWSGTRNDVFELGNPSELTYLTEEKPTLDFAFTGLDGKELNLDAPQFSNKVKIVTIMGTWCPNCKDEMIFLNGIKDSYGDKVEVMAVGFERPKDKSQAMTGLQRYSDKMNLKYPIVYGGTASKKVASETFPFLNKIISFPTLMLIDKDNKVQYIHTGFNGPATSKYKAFEEEFNKELQKLI